MMGIEDTGGFDRELATALDAAKAASEAILRYYTNASASTYTKADGSPVTDADLAADRVIRERISASFPADALLTEEGASDPARLDNPRVWIVDPIDGTAQFVARTGEFDVLIALAVDGLPFVAVSANPVRGRVHVAIRGKGAWEIVGDVATPFRIELPPEPPRIVTSKWYGGREERGDAVRRVAARIGSPEPAVLEVGYHARAWSPDGRGYDAYVGLPAPVGALAAQEWDLACNDLITSEAGGVFTDCWGRAHRYNKRSTNISGGILASASAGLHNRLLEALASELPATPPAPDPADDGY
jgi:3'-phosphoadenosine 5'-phosphosulfate (PAPS) 3'-phosphatase